MGATQLDWLRRWRADRGQQGRPEQRFEGEGRVLLWLLMAATLAAILIPAILLQQPARVFLLKVVAIGLLAFLPGWLYLQFIRNRGQSLYDEYVLNLFRLHIDEYRNLPAPPVHTSYYQLWLADRGQLAAQSRDTKDNLYRRKFETVYGPPAVSTRALLANKLSLRERAETFSPVIFATVLLGVGWVLVLQPELYGNVGLLSGLQLSGRPLLPGDALQYGFVGAYSFILQDLIRRYFREDLKAGAYISAVVRIVFVAVVVSAVHLVWPARPEQEAVFAFLLGFFPQMGLQMLQAALTKPMRRWMPAIASDYPLSELDGLNLWYEARLLEEGIEDAQNLATANLVDVLLQTRLPVARLVDWVDQACLHLHLPRAAEQRRDMSDRLRLLGIRTATDLRRRAAVTRDRAQFAAAFGEAFGQPPASGQTLLASHLKSLDGDANLWHVEQFRRHEWLTADRHQPLQGPPAGAPPAARTAAPDPDAGSTTMTESLQPPVNTPS
ncbi:MAG: hypothetical protein M3415_03850 [Actinomycetota bacterium]|nr:hypothetical protein [Actinomycetota bacterium]